MRQTTASRSQPMVRSCKGSKVKATDAVALGANVSFFDSEKSCFPVFGSSISISTCPLCTLPVVLTTRLESIAWSPILTKRGMLGIIITLFFATVVASSSALFISLSCANPSRRHVVTLSGSVNFRLTFPLLSVCSAGKKNAVSLKFLRRDVCFCTGCCVSLCFFGTLYPVVTTSLRTALRLPQSALATSSLARTMLPVMEDFCTARDPRT